MPDEPASNWKQATAAAAEELATLVCQECGAANRPGVSYVEIAQNGTCFCTVCGKAWSRGQASQLELLRSPDMEALIEQAARAHGTPKDIRAWAHRIAKDVGKLTD